MNGDTITSVSAAIGGGFFGGLLLGYALKKIVKIAAVILGLFIAGLIYLQYQRLATFNWDRIEGTISTIANATTNTINDYNIETLTSTTLGIPLTSVRYSLRVDGKKVQQLIDDHIRALDIAELMNPREVTYDNFLGYASKFKSEKGRTALVKNKARQIIKELAPTNPVYYEKLRERLEKIIEEEESRRIQDASYFNKIKEIYNEALNAEKEGRNLDSQHNLSLPFMD